MTTITLSRRLAAAAQFARHGSFVADIGTDHAYLPIYLCQNGISRGAVASDVNPGPMKRAESHVSAYSLENKITVCLCDGLDGLEKYSPEDIFMLGMGGELIVSLLSRAPWLKNKKTRLVLQPMTHPEAVRRYLISVGFTIVDESLVLDDKIYQIICAEWSPENAPTPDAYPTGYSSATDLELMFGKINLCRGGELLERYLTHWEDILEVRRKGKLCGSAEADVSEENRLLEQIRKTLNEIRNSNLK